MDSLFLVLVGITLFSNSLTTFKQDLRNPLFREFICRNCEIVGYQTDSGYISINPFHPNGICLFRMILAFVALYIFMFANGQFDWVIVYLFSAFGDAVDGMVARACEMETEFGKKFDPFCDKMTYIPFMMAFAYRGYFSEIAIISLMIFIVIEMLGQTLVRSILIKIGKPIGANVYGKIKAAIAFSVPPYVFVATSSDWVPDIGSGLMLVCTFLAIMSVLGKLFPEKL